MVVRPRISTLIAVSSWLLLGYGQQGQCLPPPEDIPEEVLRTEVIIAGRSPINGKPLTAGEYDALMETLADPNRVNVTPASVRDLIFLLQIRRVVKPIIPIIP